MKRSIIQSAHKEKKLLTLSSNGVHGFSAVGEVEASGALELGHDGEGVVLAALGLGLANGVADRAAALPLVGAQRDADVAAPTSVGEARVVGRSCKKI